MIVLLVQTVVAEMQVLLNEEEEETSLPNPKNIPANLQLPNALQASELTPEMSQERKLNVENAIRNQKRMFEERLMEISHLQSHKIPPMSSSTELSDAVLTQEERELKQQMDQLKKAVDILSRINAEEPLSSNERTMMDSYCGPQFTALNGHGPMRGPPMMEHLGMPPYIPPVINLDDPKPRNSSAAPNVNHNNVPGHGALTKAQRKKLRKMEKRQQHQRSRQHRSMPVPVIDLESSEATPRTSARNSAPPPAPLINPALDYLYNPHVVQTIQSNSDGTTALQVGYLPELEYGGGEDPYSELLNETPKDKHRKKKSGDKSRSHHEHDRRHRSEHRRRHGDQQQLMERRQLEEKIIANEQRERSLERRERSLERRERLEREERRVRYERFERERRYDQAKRERIQWERSEQQRRERYEQEKRYMQEQERALYERYERERRQRFEGERKQWEHREREKLRRELEEEMEAEKDAKNVGRTGVRCLVLN